MTELTLALLLWIDSNTSLKYSDSPLPSIEIASMERLHEIRYRDDVSEGIDSETSNTVGVYVFEERKIYLWEKFDLHSIDGKAALVHELVHYIQYETGMNETADCTEQLEFAAYRAEGEFLKQHGVKPKFDGMHVMLASMCWDS